MNKRYFDDGSITDHANSLCGEILLQHETERLMNELVAEKDTTAEKEMNNFFDKYEADHLQIIDSAIKTVNLPQRIWKSIGAVVRVAAMVIAVLSIAGGIAVASSSSLRGIRPHRRLSAGRQGLRRFHRAGHHDGHGPSVRFL